MVATGRHQALCGSRQQGDGKRAVEGSCYLYVRRIPECFHGCRSVAIYRQGFAGQRGWTRYKLTAG